MNFGKIFFTGLLISFLGALPLGTLNVAAMQISVSDGIRPAFYFAIGALIVEIIYVRLSLVAMDWVRKQKVIFRWLEWITLIIVVALAVSSFIAASNPSGGKNVILSNTLHRFWLGVMMSAINPVQIPFWFGWSTVLFTKKVLLPRNDYYNTYIAGIGIGSLVGFSVFVLGGQLLVDKLNRNQHVLHWIIGGIFALTAIIQAWKMFRHKDAVHQLEHPKKVTHGLDKNIH